MKLALTYLSDFTASVLLTLIEDSCSPTGLLGLNRVVQ